MRSDDLRVYPASCQSSQCGRLTCPPDCRSLPRLRAFEQWQDDHRAVVKDPIWSPTVYTATR